MDLDKYRVKNGLRSVDNAIIHIYNRCMFLRLCQPENTDVYGGKAEVDITFEG